VLLAFGVTVAIAGPRAWRIAKAELRTDAALGATVDLDRVGLVDAPEWARGALLRAVLRDLEPRLVGTVRMLDDDGARALVRRLESSPWVARVALERRFPDRFSVSLDLRRPLCVLEVGGEPVAMLDAEAVLIPPAREPVELPVIDLDGPWQLDVTDFGQPVRDERVRAAVAVADEWETRITPEVPGLPELVAIDPRNLRWRYVAEPRVSQIVVVLRRGDGATASFQYGRAEVDGGPVEVGVRADLLRRVLEEFPGLDGIERGDLRVANRWREKLSPPSLAAGEDR
jgi:hypothetical protein